MRGHVSVSLILISLAIIAGFVFAGPGMCRGAKEGGPVRSPAVAGAFYPAGRGELGALVDSYLARAKPPRVPGEPVALVVPHAGYVYSGQVAAYGYKTIEGRKYDAVIIMCDSHSGRFDGVAVFPRGEWRTPLGDVAVDAELAARLAAASPRIRSSESAFSGDHTIEVQLPFLQKVLGNFKIVPILFGNSGGDDYEALAKAILEGTEGKNVLVIATSDLSHYPSYDDAKAVDAGTVAGILSGDVKQFDAAIARGLAKGYPNLLTCACGSDGVKTAMLVARGWKAERIALLDAANSGDVSGDKGRVVGYAAIGFFGPRREAGGMEGGGGPLGQEEQEELIRIARQSVETFVRKGRAPKFEVSDPALNERLGAFVTLKKGGRLRGCIGKFSPTSIPLYEVVSQMAISAASQDVRFPPVKSDELGELSYEVSVLSVPEQIKDWREVEVGRHGVIMRKGFRSGVFLPQVATENKMTREQFLGELCSQKARLPRDCYRDPGTSMYVFTAQVFGDKGD